MADTKKLPSLPIRQVRGYVTNVDLPDLKEEYVIDAVNARFDRAGVVAERMPGTKHRFSSYPQETAHTVTDATTGPLVVTIGTHPYQNGDLVDISGIVGITGVNLKRQIVTAHDSTTITIGALAGTGTYTSGGTVRLTMEIVDSQPLLIVSENLEYEILVCVDGRGNLRIWVRPISEATDWDELTQTFTALLAETPDANDLDVNIDTIKSLVGDTGVFGDHGLRYFIAYNKTRSNAAFVVDSTTSTASPVIIYSENKLGSGCLAWQDNNEIIFYRMQGVCDIDLGTLSTFFNQGRTPHLRWLATPELNKVNMYWGNSATIPTMQYPLRIQKSAVSINGSVFYTTGGVDRYQLQTPTAWHMDLAETTDKYVSVGTQTSPILVANPSITADSVVEIGEGIQVSAHFPSALPLLGGETGRIYARYYMTLLYRGVDNATFYEESDAIWKLFVAPSVDDSFVAPMIAVGIDLSRLNKTVVGFRLYYAEKNSEDVSSSPALWGDDPTEYLHIPPEGYARGSTIPVTYLFDAPADESGMFLNSSSRYTYTYGSVSVGYIQPGHYSAADANSIVSLIGHTPDVNRTRLKPRFACRAEIGIGQDQGSVILVDENDRRLRRSCYGNGTHMDDHFPDVSLDANDNPQRVLLAGSDRIINLAAIGNGVLLAIRHKEIEFFDLQSRQSYRQYADVASGRAAIQTNMGVLFLGDSNIYMIDATGGPIQAIGRDIQNLVDGSLRLLSDPSKAKVTSTARASAIAGYDRTFQTVWLHIQVYQEDGTQKYVNHVFSLGRKNYSPRILNIGDLGSGKTPVRSFSTRSDGSMTIVYADGLLGYPNLSSDDTRFEDDVESDGTSAGKGGEFDFTVVLGSLSALSTRVALAAVIPDVQGQSVDGMGAYGLKFYANREADPFDSKLVFIDEKPRERGIDQSRGDVEIARIELYLPSDDLDNFREITVSSIEVPYIKKAREGNS
jgi:hypothetical protein